MPWKTSDVDRFNKGLSRKEKRKWVSIANSSLKACIESGGSDATCAPKAIQTANGVIRRDKEKEMAMKNKPEIEKNTEIEEGSETKEIEEMYDNEIPYVPSSIVAFDQLDAMQITQEISEKLRCLTGLYNQMVSNIVYWYEGDKVAQLKIVSAEFADRIEEILSSRIDGDDQEVPGDTPMDQGQAIAAEKLTEAETGEIIALEEADLKEADSVLHLNVAIIRPGWGNKVDNHYYSAEMLQNCAANFSGAKMYETDHIQAEKNTRTWVSTITEIKGFTDEGAPIARVAVHDPNFAERLKNLSAAGLLGKMECSILASGIAEPGFELGGRKGKKVLSITDVESVDWVTRAGAGGRALELTESDKVTEGGIEMSEAPNTVVNNTITTEQSQPEVEAETVKVENNETVKVEVTEAVTSGSETVANAKVEEIQVVTQACLSEAEVRSQLEASNLHPASIERLLLAQYADNEMVQTAITMEKAYLAKVMEAGKVYGMGVVGDSQRVSIKDRQTAINEAADRVNSKFFGGKP